MGENGQPIDWIYRYCNQAFSDVKGYRLEAIINQSMLSLSPFVSADSLNIYYQAAYENKPCKMKLTMGRNYNAAIMPVGIRGYCSCMLYETTYQQDTEKSESKLNQNAILSKLLPEYVSLYHVELNSGKYKILRLAGNTNARQIAEHDLHPLPHFDDYTRRYANSFIQEEDRKEFYEWHFCCNMKKRLQKADKATYHYHSVSKDGKDSYYEAYAVKGMVNKQEFHIFLGYRNVDSILYKEKMIQEKLERALEETKLSNEIISAIAKTYQYISRIDIEADWYEEITNREWQNLRALPSGIHSVTNKKVCKQLVAEAYQEVVWKFADISTLPERMKNEETIAIEYQMKDNSWHKLRFIEKKRDVNGRLTHVLCAIRSISAEKKQEQQLLQQVAAAKKEVALKTKFLSDMSHDIRTPMNGIIGMINLANRYPNDSEMQQKCRDRMLESSQYLLSLVNDILDMNKLESGDLNLTEQAISFELSDLLNKVNNEKRTKAVDKEIHYIIDREKERIIHNHLTGNPIYLERVLTIIVDNAVKFTNSGGNICVWCLEQSDDGEQAVYEFGCSDTGIGMSESFIGHAFDIFSQENKTSRSVYEGTGLGLSLVKKIVEYMKGNIEIESQKNVGTTVRVTIPLKIEQVDNTGEAKNCKEISLSGMRALIAEDNELNMEIARFILEDHGIFTECAWNGVEAVEKFEKSSVGYYDIILMDIMMPKLNGWMQHKRFEI